MELRLPVFEGRLDPIARVAARSNPLRNPVLRIPVIQHHAVGVDLQHIAIDREDAFQGGAGVKNGRAIVEPVEQVQVEGAVRQVESEEPERSAHVDRKMSHQGIMRSFRTILARSFEDTA
jgi:hypothetical protein